MGQTRMEVDDSREHVRRDILPVVWATCLSASAFEREKEGQEECESHNVSAAVT